MSGFAAIVGYCVIILGALLAVAIAVGRFFDRKTGAEPEDWDPAPRNLGVPLVPPQWRADNDDRRDPPPHDPAP